MIEITIEGPGKNALGSELMTQLLEQIRAAEGQPILLRGGGDSFSAGLNLREVAALDAAGMERFLRLLGDLSAELFDYPGPTVALVNGHAIAGGLVLALCCDYRVGANAPRARIGLNEIALGLRFPARLLRMLRYALPSLDRVVLPAKLHSPEEALRLGLLDELASPEDAELRAKECLEGLAKHPPAGYAAAKADLRAGVTRVDPEEERAFLEEVIPVWTADELKATVRAMLGG
ncbi:MAG: enoyl-CoA hydratase/isomerase family protein [Planctomycetes bacterium]|nr:enoyl-CoA hydratase/isomerase family protein [Planctomycetota bacterium]